MLNVKDIDLVDYPEYIQEAAAKIKPYSSIGGIKVGEVGFTIPKGQEKTVEKIQNMEVGEKDVWIVTYPRSGTTWTQEILWNIRNGVNVEKSKKIDIDLKFDFLDMDFLDEIDSDGNTDTAMSKFGKERNIKTHLPFSLLPKDLLEKAKVVYVGRNPKDVVVSYFHHQRLVKSSSPDLEFKDFVGLFMAELIKEDPYAGNIKEAWMKRDHPNLLFLWYEDMKRDLPAALRTISAFLGKPLTEEDINTLADHVSIDNMKKNPAVNHKDRHEKGVFLAGESFVRSGISGGWTKYFSEELEKEFDTWIEQKFKNSGIPFKYV